jgi:hypothetical protein
VLVILRFWHRDGYREEHTCWVYCGFFSGMATDRNTSARYIYGFGSGMATERNTRACYIAGLASGWIQRGTHVLAILRVWQRDGYREEHTCWPYCGFGSGMVTERNTRASHIAGLAAGWLQIGTHVLALLRIWQRDGYREEHTCWKYLRI